MANARNAFSDLCNRVAYANDRVLITRHGKPIMAMIPVSSYELLEKIERLLDRQSADEAIAGIDEHGAISMEEFKKRLGVE